MPSAVIGAMILFGMVATSATILGITISDWMDAETDRAQAQAEEARKITYCIRNPHSSICPELGPLNADWDCKITNDIAICHKIKMP